MKKYGFTLVELLATIALIGILVTLSAGLMVNSMDNSKIDLDEFQKDLLLSTARMYFDDNVNTRDSVNGSTYNICVQKNLVQGGYMEEFKDSEGNEYRGIVVLTTEVNNGTIKNITSEIREGSEIDCWEE